MKGLGIAFIIENEVPESINTDQQRLI